jgi:antitoxin (DNA-binding transcriptional repressor) of toxin-antitoxin stability system
MRTAKEQLPRLAREVSLGSRLTITVHGRPVADLVPHVPEVDAPKRVRTMPQRFKMSPGASIDDLLDGTRGES